MHVVADVLVGVEAAAPPAPVPQHVSVPASPEHAPVPASGGFYSQQLHRAVVDFLRRAIAWHAAMQVAECMLVCQVACEPQWLTAC